MRPGIKKIQVVVVRVEGTDLELSDAALLLEDLEDWAVVLKGDREIIHRLEAFERAARGGACGPADEAAATPGVDRIEDPSP